MYTLYFAPGACSLAPHIMLNECHAAYTLDKVNLKTKETKSGLNFLQINPKGSVPALRLPNGEVLTECAVILQALAYEFPEKELLPLAGTNEHIRCLEWLNTISTELHKGFTPLFAAHKWIENAEGLNQMKNSSRELLKQRLKLVDEHFADERAFLLGREISVADIYLFNVLNWGQFVEVKISEFPFLNKFHQQMSKRPSVEKSFQAEGLQ